jgi:hypothetical protein
LGIKQNSRLTAKEEAKKWLDSKSGKEQVKNSVHEWISNNPREMDKIFTKAAKEINRKKAKAAPENGMSESSESDLINSLKNESN